MRKERGRYKARFHHSGAMIEEMLLLTSYFDPDVDKKTWEQKVVSENLLAKNTRNWVKEVVSGSFYPRLVNGPIPESWQIIRRFTANTADQSILHSILYYITAKYDEFLYDFVTEEVHQRFYSGQLNISPVDVYNYIHSLPEELFNKPWSDYVQRRYSGGIMATLRDFGILEGKSHKKIANYYLPMATFVFVAYLLNQNTKSGEKNLHHKDWNLFLLNSRAVERMYLQAHQLNYLSYHAAGGIIRIEFPFDSTGELIDAVSR